MLSYIIPCIKVDLTTNKGAEFLFVKSQIFSISGRVEFKQKNYLKNASNASRKQF